MLFIFTYTVCIISLPDIHRSSVVHTFPLLNTSPLAVINDIFWALVVATLIYTYNYSDTYVTIGPTSGKI